MNFVVFHCTMECEVFDAIDCSAVPGSYGIRNFGEACGTGSAVAIGAGGMGASILAPPFSPRIGRAIVAGFDRIDRAHELATRKWPHK